MSVFCVIVTLLLLICLVSLAIHDARSNTRKAVIRRLEVVSSSIFEVENEGQSWQSADYATKQKYRRLGQKLYNKIKDAF